MLWLRLNAETGKLDSADKTAEKALDIARGGGETNLAVMTESLLKLTKPESHTGRERI